MKIMFTFLTYGIDIFGGVEKSLFCLIEGLLKNNIEVVVYTGKMKKENNILHKVFYSNFLLSDFSQYNTFNINDAILNNYNEYNEELLNEILDVISIEKPDYILAVDHIWGIIPYVNIFEYVDCPVGLIFHMLHEEELVKKIFDYPFDKFFCVSSYIKNGLNRIVEKDIDFVVCPNAISSQFLIKERRYTLKPHNIFCNARIAEGKGIEYLIEAFAILSPSYPDIKLYLCNGDFHFMDKIDLKSKIQQINSNYEEERVILLPNLRWDEIPLVLEKMDLVVLPTELETFGLGALETIASRIPLITTNAGNLGELLKDSVIYIQPKSVDSIVESIKKYINNYYNVEELLEKGYQIARNYIDVIVAKRLVEALDRNVGENL